jgi:hypothetical protein
MAYKMSLILSFLFVIHVFLLGGDIISAQYIYTEIDAVSMTVGNLISEYGGINEDIVLFVKNQCSGELSCLSNCIPKLGDPYVYKISCTFDPLIMSSEVMTISITRSIVIGYFN